MKTLTVTYKGHAPPLTVTVSEAIPIMEVHRSIHQARALLEIKTNMGLQPEEPVPEDLQPPVEVLRMVPIFSTCMACIARAEGFSLAITFNEFCRLPVQFVVSWYIAACELNPAWRHVSPVKLGELVKPGHLRRSSDADTKLS